MATAYPFDPTGTNPSNRITGEQHVITSTSGQNYHFIVPTYAPFFSEGCTVSYKAVDNTIRYLVEGIDFYFCFQFIAASRSCAKPIYGGISFLNLELAGLVTIVYQTVGGEWTLDPVKINEILSDTVRNPRVTSWEHVASVPTLFPVVDHEWNLVDLVGMSDVSDKVNDIALAIANKAQYTGIGDYILPTKDMLGLGKVKNFGIATDAEAVEGTSITKYMTPRAVRKAIQFVTGDGGGSGTGLQYLTEVRNASAPNSEVVVHGVLASGAEADIDLVLSPKGGGAIVAHVPDGTATGGNKRGQWAVDLQIDRTDATQVASGEDSTVAGGYCNTASGLSAVVSGGSSNNASDVYSTVSGGYGNTSSNNLSTVSGGYNNTASGEMSVVAGGSDNRSSVSLSVVSGGFNNTASGQKSVVAGGESNTTSQLYAVVSGGFNNTASGYGASVFGGESNTASGFYSTVSNGHTNASSGGYSVVSGGYLNVASGTYSVVYGGYNNNAAGNGSTISGGYSNTANSLNSAVSGGQENNATGGCAVVSGGFLNTVDGEQSAISSGYSNTVSNDYSVISGGETNTITGAFSVISGGSNNSLNGKWSVISGGKDNVQNGECAVVSGGLANTSSGDYSTVSGGVGNVASARYATVSGGRNGTASSLHSTVSGGDANTASGYYATVSGGELNTASSYYANVSGGYSNTANNEYSSVGGGSGNVASGMYSVVSGGEENVASAYGAGVSGGYKNVASGDYSVVSGGANNSASGAFATIPGGARGYAGGMKGVLVYGFNAYNLRPCQMTFWGGIISTTGNTPTRLTSGGEGGTATNQLTLRANSGFRVRGTIVALASNATSSKEWTFELLIKRGSSAASTTMVGTPIITSNFADAGASGWTISLSADTTNGSLAISVTGGASTEIYWAAVTHSVEITLSP